MDGPSRLSTFDALRGLAALLVMLFHAGWRSPLPVPGGYLAVDLFFALSGFVLSRAYEDRIRAGLPWRTFMLARLIRVAPMAMIGGMLGVLLWQGRPETMLLIPDFTSSQNLFPSNPPLWSLLFELIVNAAWALAAVRIGWPGLLLVLTASGGLMGEAILMRGEAMDLGSFWFTAVAGLARTVFSFTIGIALFRLAEARCVKPRRTMLGWALLPALALLLAYGPGYRGWWDLVCIVIFLPGLLWLGVRWELPARAPAAFLGDLSYPLYCIHVPIVALCRDAGLGMACVLALLVLIASALDRWYDRPLRTLLLSLTRAPVRPAAA